MKRILVLGAGLVAGPAVRHLLAQPDLEVCVADQVRAKARALVGDHNRGQVQAIDANDPEGLSALVKNSDIVISLLPWTLHPRIAKLCLKFGVHLVTASYVKEEMQAFHQEAQAKGVLFLNEVGVDPGLDHMSAMQVIHKVQQEGGR
ncbi:MAG: saccharopine dehydrogenase NADP-binding domain-containing protein, partial [Desulfobacterales bacterium]